MMGVQVAAGRDFQPSDGVPQAPPPPGADAAPAGPPVPNMVILSHEYWQRRYGGQPVIGQNLGPAGPPTEIVGVLSPGFRLMFPAEDNVEAAPDIWIANRLNYNNANRNAYGLRPIGRLKPGVAIAEAQESVERVATVIRRDFPIYGTGNFYARVEPMHGALVSEVRPAILALMGAGAFLLLIACANVANLLLVRASNRQAELAVRSALGASAWRVIQPVLAEAIVLAALGVAAGVALAWIGVRALLSVAPPDLPRLNEVAIDWPVLAFAAVMGALAALIFGVAPALSARRLRPNDALRGSGRMPGLGRGGRVRSAVLMLQVALCFVLLVGAGLMVRSFSALQRVDPGFNPDRMLTFRLLGPIGGPPQQRLATMRQLREKLSSIPGVTDVTASFPFPLTGDFSTIRWGLEDALADNSKYQAVDWQAVWPGYFDVLGTSLIAGRAFTDADNESRQPVVLVDTTLAAKAFPGESAIGKRILIRIRTPEPEWVEIIGVVEHQRVATLARPGREQVYFTDGFLNYGRARKWGLRVNGDAAAIAPQVRARIAEVNPQLLVSDVATFDELVTRASAGTRFQLLLVSVLAGAAALLVAVGLYGLLSTMVRQRTAEIGVRMAMGASPAGILRMVLSHGFTLTTIGMLVGLGAALGLTRLVRSLLVGIEPTDPPTYVAMVLIFLIIAGVSAWLPARRAAALESDTGAAERVRLPVPRRGWMPCRPHSRSRAPQPGRAARIRPAGHPHAETPEAARAATSG